MPIITLTTDFGLRDAYVAEMKAVLYARMTDATIVDVTHDLPPQDVTAAAVVVGRVVGAFEAGCVHVAVVDPGVGTARRLLAVQLRGQTLLCPDNGLASWAWRLYGEGRAWEMTWRPGAVVSRTFHGRDILAPLAAMIATGTPLASLGHTIDDPVQLELNPARSTSDPIRIIHIDHFGNATTNLLSSALSPATKHAIVRGKVVPLHQTYGDVPRGAPVALVGSSGLLEIAVNQGSAQSDMHLQVGDAVEVR